MSSFRWSKDDNRCFACGDNPWGLNLDIRKEKGFVEATTCLDDNYQGFKGIAHGGIVATILDEMAAWAAMTKTGSVAPSFKMECDFLEPVPLNEKIVAEGRVRKVRHGIVEVETRLEDEKEKLLARADVKCKVLEDGISYEEV